MFQGSQCVPDAVQGTFVLTGLIPPVTQGSLLSGEEAATAGQATRFILIMHTLHQSPR